MTEITGFSSICASNILEEIPTEITIFDNNNKFLNIYNLKGGILAWANEIDSNILVL